MPRTFHNPIIPGFYPDPSLCRVGEDYYLITSTFEYFPGLPIFHSRDLVNWRQIGHVLDRPEQLDLDGMRPSGGLFAPTIRYHDGLFYVVNTLAAWDRPVRGNFYVTAADPAGPWSMPNWLPDAPGIDPSILFDDDGRAWYTGNRPAPGARYDGHLEIWLQELDLAGRRLTGPVYGLWDGAAKEALWAEAPHLYHIGDWYYLMIAEGGTGHEHAVTIARSRNITGPYESNQRNPVLTHRHLGLDYPIVGTGHADLVQTQTGQWWLVCLAMRPYGGYHYNLGRETFLAPVRWEDGWPVVSPGTGKVEWEYAAPDLPEHPWPSPPARDDFEADRLALCWNFIRTPREAFWSLAERKGHLRLRLRPETASERVCPSFVGRRQRHVNFAETAAMDFTPRTADECAGLVLRQREEFHIRFVVSRGPADEFVAQVVRREGGIDSVVATRTILPGRAYLKVEAHGQDYGFYVASVPDRWLAVAEKVDGRALSTPVAGGFVGAYVGMYASSNGAASVNVADFDWFEYRGIN